MTGIFLTGATGLLGRYLLRDLLLAGRQVVVLARSRNDGMSARQRIDDAIRPFERALQRTIPRPFILEGDLHQPGLGLSMADRNWLAQRVPLVLHCAASIKFYRTPSDDEPFLSNVEGTRRLLEFCSDAGLEQLHYVSTAYVCGNRTGTVMETEFDQGQTFRNDYEQSKFTAERLVRSANFLKSLTVYRPSIIVGDAATGYTSTFHGFYLPLQLAYAATTAGLLQDRADYMASLGLQGNERKNLVPVNWVSAVLVRILDDPQLHRRTYHLTNPQPVTTTEIEQSITESIRLSQAKPQLARTSSSASAPQLDDFRTQMRVYAAYLSDDPEFDRRQTDEASYQFPCPRLDRETLLRLARYAISNGFGWPRSKSQPFDLDMNSLWEQLEVHDGPRTEFRMSLEISGSCGGAWDVVFDRGMPFAVEDRPNGDRQMSVYMNVHTLKNILAERASVGSSLSRGGIVLEGSVDDRSRGVELLEALCVRLREAQWEIHSNRSGNTRLHS